MENVFSVRTGGKIEDIEDYGCDCSCYEIRMKKNHEKIAYYTISGWGVWIEDKYLFTR